MKPNSLVRIILVIVAIADCVAHQVHAQNSAEPALLVKLNAGGDRVHVFRRGTNTPLVTQVARADFRPFLHPLLGPDGRGVLTELSPEHHKHQTGLFWGFTQLNGRDYFHHPGATHWRRVNVQVLTAEARSKNDPVQWHTIYDLLAEDGTVVLQESQIWSLTTTASSYTLEVQWSGTARTDVTVSKYDYGGLFLRMPWKPGMTGEAINSARQRGLRAEGQRAVWMDVGLQVEGREDLAHIAIFDHPQNKGFPQPWRVDGQLGVGPVRARMGDWRLAKDQTEKIRHQVVVFTGALDDVALTERWSEFSGQKLAYAQWRQAQEEGRRAEFLTPEKAVQQMTVPRGCTANIYAAEPMITQPMAFCWDDRGRLWVAENRDYESRGDGFSNSGDSRIVILEDTDGNGTADKRNVFADGIPFPAGIAVGMGGLWLGAPPNLLFIPDADGDDQADQDDIQVRLTGWGIRDRHETLNSFHWGPDGWLYGCQGYATASRVGRPAGKGKLYGHQDPFPRKIDFDGEPVDINGGVWRYHPSKDRFEVVAHGFSNPWGMDFDAKGQLFITACVIPHLWHVIPGGIYHRQGGRHYNAHVYNDIKTIADHRHRSAHGGARVYLSDAFPEKYKGQIFMANIHEHAVLTDILEPQGSGFVGRHGEDFALANNAQWIGFSVEIGPDGNLYVLDWHDADICGKEVLNKETGRIFRFAPQESQAVEFPHRYTDLRALTDRQLFELQRVESAWHGRRARLILQQRAADRHIDAAVIADCVSILTRADASDATLRLRCLWLLHVIGISNEQLLVPLLQDTDPWIQGWAVQLLCEDHDASETALAAITNLAADCSHPVVRLYLGSAMQRVPAAIAWQLAESLAAHGEDANDHNIPKMIWFGLEPQVLNDTRRALQLAQSSAIPLVAQHIARRLTEAERFETLVAAIIAAETNQMSLLRGLRDGLEGRYDIAAPPNWGDAYAKLRQAGGEASRIALQLSQQFGDTIAATAMLSTVNDPAANIADRVDALQGLAGRRRPELVTVLPMLLNDPLIRPHAIRATAALDDSSLTAALLKRYDSFSESDKLETVLALAARSRSGRKLTEAIKSGAVPRRDVPAYVARLLRRVVGNGFVDVWGTIDELSANTEASLVHYRGLLRPDAIAKANPVNGRRVFNRTCAACHKLFGHGGVIGPDITGANRPNIEYLLGNILTPSAIIQDAYKMHIILTNDGRVYSGIPAEENDRVLKLRVANRDAPVAIAKSNIEAREIAPISMMPEGILKTMSDTEVLDLMSYLQSPKQLELEE